MPLNMRNYLLFVYKTNNQNHLRFYDEIHLQYLLVITTKYFRKMFLHHPTYVKMHFSISLFYFDCTSTIINRIECCRHLQFNVIQSLCCHPFSAECKARFVTFFSANCSTVRYGKRNSATFHNSLIWQQKIKNF